jgi:hypothetical protein
MSSLRLPDPPGEFSLPLTPERLDWQLKVLNWSNGELSRRLDIRPNKASAWIAGRSFVPNRVAVWLEDLAQRTVAGPQGWAASREAGAAHHQHEELAHPEVRKWT